MRDDKFVYPDERADMLYEPKAIEKVYSRITDEVSKNLFSNRLMYSLTGDLTYIGNVILNTETGLRLYQRLKNEKNGIAVYGAGKRGRQLVGIFPKLDWRCFIDKSYTEKQFDGISIIPLDDYKFRNELVIISVQSGFSGIKEELISSKKIPEDRIICLQEMNMEASGNQYFDARLLHPEDINNGFVDAGMYDGEDILRFRRWRGRNVRSWGFEPDHECFCNSKLTLSGQEEVMVYEMALTDSSQKMKVGINDNMPYMSEEKNSIDNKSHLTQGVCLDDILGTERIDFIKMDIEGYEEKALRGSRGIIRDQKPFLAICIYHKRHDIYCIPKLLLEINKDYRFGLGHYSLTQVDTVLYAF